MGKLTRKQIEDIKKLNNQQINYDQIAKEVGVTVHDVVRVLQPNR